MDKNVRKYNNISVTAFLTQICNVCASFECTFVFIHSDEQSHILVNIHSYTSYLQIKIRFHIFFLRTMITIVFLERVRVIIWHDYTFTAEKIPSPVLCFLRKWDVGFCRWQESKCLLFFHGPRFQVMWANWELNYWLHRCTFSNAINGFWKFKDVLSAILVQSY